MNKWRIEILNEKCQEKAKYLHCKKNDGNLSFHSGNYIISCYLIFLHFVGGFIGKLKEKMERVSGNLGSLLTYEIMPYSNVYEVKKYLVCFQIKNIFCIKV